MKHLSSSWSVALAAGLLANLAQAQTRFSIGPSVGFNVSSAPYRTSARAYNTTNSLGAEAGVLAVFSRQHIGLQTALLFSQKGFEIHDETHYDDGKGRTSSSYVTANYRFNYLTLPLNLVYSLRGDGQGFQVFAGGYLGLLLGGNYEYKYSYSASFPGGATGGTSTESGAVVAGDYFPNNGLYGGVSDNNFYSRALDAGLQGGLGYRVGKALVQVSYSHGLRNLAADEEYGYGTSQQISPSGIVYRNRALQASFSYRLLPRN